MKGLASVGLVTAVCAAGCGGKPSPADPPRAGGGEPAPKTLTAREVLDRTAKVYAECKSYRDSGVVRSVLTEPAGDRTVEFRTTTAFVRPDRFRFGYGERVIDGRRRNVIWRRGAEVRTTWSGNEKPESLEAALMAAFGVTSGTSGDVPQLLFPGEKWLSATPFTEAKEANRIADDKVDGVVCYRIQRNRDTSRTYWIDQATFLLRRIDSQDPLKRTITYTPAIDQEITDAELEFEPPAGK